MSAKSREEVYILGIESSCDETAAAVVRSGEHTESNIVLSQLKTHAIYGGVVPELASREHLRGIAPVVRIALKEAGQSYESIHAIAVTQGPGLAGSLLVGVSYAKALAFALEKPLIAVNHLEGHIHAVLLEEKQRGNREIALPALALVVSGGHTHLFLCKPLEDVATAPRPLGQADGFAAAWEYELVGRTRDDAAGEAYDKVAKLLGLGYPGGPVIDKLAPHGNPQAVRFSPAQIKHKERGAERMEILDFSFSGIKTAVLRYIELNGMQAQIEARRKKLGGIPKPTLEDYLSACDQKTLDLIASFQRAVVEDLVGKTIKAAEELQPASLLVTGGVAANRELRAKFGERAKSLGLPVYFPSMPLSTDNAAMIAAAAYPKFLVRGFANLHLSADAALKLG
jgi:N6-L-threonylcarbamoyladenine synthase